MSQSMNPSRRSLLQAGALSLGAAALGPCGVGIRPVACVIPAVDATVLPHTLPHPVLAYLFASRRRALPLG